MNTINGFLVLKKAEFLEDTFYRRRFTIGNKEYQGIERPHLYDLKADYYRSKKEIPSEIISIVENSNNESNDFTFLPLIKEFEDAKRALGYSNRVNCYNELIALKSEKLNTIKGVIEFYEEIDWLGYDLISYGRGSLIFLGIFTKPDLFKKWVTIINDNGLFSDSYSAKSYLEDYLRYAKKGEVEDHIFSELGFDFIRVGRVNQ